MSSFEGDLGVLEKYQFMESDDWKESKFNRKNNNVLLGVQNGRLVTVNPADITFLNLFLRIFGKGKLAHTHISINSISKHLVQYNWKQLSNDDSKIANSQALRNVQTIAAKSWQRELPRKLTKLLKENATLTKTNYGRFYLTESTTARDFMKQVHYSLIDARLLRVKDGVETPILPTEIINLETINTSCIAYKCDRCGRLHLHAASFQTKTNVSLVDLV